MKKSVHVRLNGVAPLAAVAGIKVSSAKYFARETRSYVIKVHKPYDYAAEIQQIVNRLRAQYKLGFELDDKDTDDNKLHTLEVQLRPRGATGAKAEPVVVLSRHGYYLP